MNYFVAVKIPVNMLIISGKLLIISGNLLIISGTTYY